MTLACIPECLLPLYLPISLFIVAIMYWYHDVSLYITTSFKNDIVFYLLRSASYLTWMKTISTLGTFMNFLAYLTEHLSFLLMILYNSSCIYCYQISMPWSLYYRSMKVGKYLIWSRINLKELRHWCLIMNRNETVVVQYV